MSEIVEETAATAQFEELPDAPPRRRMKFSWSGKLGICVVAFWVVMVFVGEYIAPYHEAEMLDDSLFIEPGSDEKYPDTVFQGPRSPISVPTSSGGISCLEPSSAHGQPSDSRWPPPSWRTLRG